MTDAPLIAAATSGTPSRPPVWFMRQAGRSLPEYRRVREGISMLDSCFNPELLAEITCQPVRRHDVDAAILFSDIVVPLKAAGVDVDIVPGRGPVMGRAVRSRHDVDRLAVLVVGDEAVEDVLDDDAAAVLRRVRRNEGLLRLDAVRDDDAGGVSIAAAAAGRVAAAAAGGESED